MKQLSILFISFFILNSTLAQKIAIDAADEFTNAKTFKVDVRQGNYWKQSDRINVEILQPVYLSSKIISREEKYSIYSTYAISYGTTVCFSSSSSKCIILFEDGSTSTFEYFGEVECKEYNEFTFKLTVPDLLKMLFIGIKKIRFYDADSKYTDIEIREKSKESITKHFQILLDKIDSDFKR